MKTGLDFNPESAGNCKSVVSFEVSAEMTLWERMGKAMELDVECNTFSWECLASLHRTEHRSSGVYSEDEMSKPMEVTVNSGGIVLFALFKNCLRNNSKSNEGVAVVKISSSRMASQSERLGYEFAKHLGVLTPRARVIHNSSAEWQNIKYAAEKARIMPNTEEDDVDEKTCTEFLEALELNRCFLLIGYVHGCPLLQSPRAFDSQEAAQRTAVALGRILILDLVLRNEDRLPCRQLGWRGNPANLLFTEKLEFGNRVASVPGNVKSPPQKNRGSSFSRRRKSFDLGNMSNSDMITFIPQILDYTANETTSEGIFLPIEDRSKHASDFHIVAIDSGVPRRPPAGKRLSDISQYPRLVELLLNSPQFASDLLHEISWEKLGCHISETAVGSLDQFFSGDIDQDKVVHEFQASFRGGLREMQRLQPFIVKLHHKLDVLLKTFLSLISKYLPGDDEKEDPGVSESGHLYSPFHNLSCQSPVAGKECLKIGQNIEPQDLAYTTGTDSQDFLGNPFSKSPYKDSLEMSPFFQENYHGKYSKGNSDSSHSMRLTVKLKDLNKIAKFDSELSKELEHWNEMLGMEVIKFCHEMNFNTGFFEGGDSQNVIDSYELKVRLEHLLERMALVSQAADSERPSHVTDSLFIGGALAARSINTLQLLGVTHVLCLCANELGQSEAQYPDLFEYKNFEVSDVDDANISYIFEDASDFIEKVERNGGKVLVHCFEGKSRSTTVVLAYLMLRKHETLLEAWTRLKGVHCRAQPNDGFMKILMDLDKKLYGKPSMDWQRRKPIMRSCPICGKIVGVSSSSLKLHLQKSHRRLSSGSVDSVEVKELQRILDSVIIGC